MIKHFEQYYYTTLSTLPHGWYVIAILSWNVTFAFHHTSAFSGYNWEQNNNQKTSVNRESIIIAQFCNRFFVNQENTAIKQEYFLEPVCTRSRWGFRFVWYCFRVQTVPLAFGFPSVQMDQITSGCLGPRRPIQIFQNGDRPWEVLLDAKNSIWYWIPTTSCNICLPHTPTTSSNSLAHFYTLYSVYTLVFYSTLYILEYSYTQISSCTSCTLEILLYILVRTFSRHL